MDIICDIRPFFCNEYVFLGYCYVSGCLEPDLHLDLFLGRSVLSRVSGSLFACRTTVSFQLFG